MKTSKEAQLEILNKMKSNIENDLNILEDIEYYNHHFNEWRGVSEITRRGFGKGSYRVKPTTITVNGIDIPKPLDRDDLLMMNKTDIVYSVDCNQFLYMELPSYIAEDQGFKFIYKTKEEAIQASKLLFCIDCKGD